MILCSPSWPEQAPPIDGESLGDQGVHSEHHLLTEKQALPLLGDEPQGYDKGQPHQRADEGCGWGGREGSEQPQANRSTCLPMQAVRCVCLSAPSVPTHPVSDYPAHLAVIGQKDSSREDSRQQKWAL